MKKILSLLLVLMLFAGIQPKVQAAAIDKTISESGINKSAVSISVKDVNTGKTIYKLNDKKPTMPASTLKILTLCASLDTLGKDYNFSTKLYKNTNNELFIKLGADPFLSSGDLKDLMEKAVAKKIISPKMIYIDDYIFDNKEWGEGWQWDDDLSPLMPKFSSYNLDYNLLNIVIAPTTPNSPANIYTTKFYPVTFMNLVITGTENNVELSRNNHISPNMITAEGTVTKQIVKQVPINNPKRYFTLRAEEAISSAKMEYYGKFAQKKTPSTNIYIVSEIKHPIMPAVVMILKNSNNFMAETVFKAAGAKHVNNTGSLLNSQNMLNAYFEKLGLSTDNIKVVDGSGVSKNNLVTSDFMTEFLVKENGNKILRETLPTAGEGTLKTRMLYFKNNLHAKTGTLSDVSAIAGYITSRRRKTYAFDIMINDPKTHVNDKKSLEEYIIRDIYANY